MSPQTKIVGVTGGIGAGKSVVSRILRTYGYSVYDCDYEAKCLMNNSPDLRGALTDKFGELLYVAGSLDRKMLAEIIFNDLTSLEYVNEVVHNAVRTEMLHRIESTAAELFFVESAILASSGLADLCEVIWYVDAPLEVRKARALARGGITEKDLDQRMAVQQHELEFMSGYKYVVINNDRPLLPQINHYLKELLP